MAVRDNWASRPHCPPGDDGAVKMQKAIASGMAPPKSKRTVRLNQDASGGPGPTQTPGWFSTR